MVYYIVSWIAGWGLAYRFDLLRIPRPPTIGMTVVALLPILIDNPSGRFWREKAKSESIP